MCRIVPAIESLDQHLYHLQHDPEAYRPRQCPHCGLVGVWRHGHYRRKTDREGQEGVYLDPVPIPRFYCRHCQATCSRLPGCIAPRRWYSWLVQQAVLAVLLSGSSVRQAARMSRPARHTIRRWWCWAERSIQSLQLSLAQPFSRVGALCLADRVSGWPVLTACHWPMRWRGSIEMACSSHDVLIPKRSGTQRNRP